MTAFIVFDLTPTHALFNITRIVAESFPQPHEKQGENILDATHADETKTIDGIIHALYDSISGPADQKRDLKRFRSLFIEDARLIRTTPDEDGGGALAQGARARS